MRVVASRASRVLSLGCSTGFGAGCCPDFDGCGRAGPGLGSGEQLSTAREVCWLGSRAPARDWIVGGREDESDCDRW